MWAIVTLLVSANAFTPLRLPRNKPIQRNSYLSSTQTDGPIVRSADELWCDYQDQEKILALNPDDNQAMKRCADALCGWMRISTDGQTVLLEGPGDKQSFRKIWSEFAPRGVNLYRSLLQLESNKKDPDLLCNFIECLSSQSAAKGVAVAALSGDAVSFLQNVATLKEHFPGHNGGLAFIFTSAFYLAAPFPVRSPRRALAAAENALKIDPTSRRNRYYAGLASWACGDHVTANRYFSSSLAGDATCKSQSELDIDGVLRREAERGLGVSQKS